MAAGAAGGAGAFDEAKGAIGGRAGAAAGAADGVGDGGDRAAAGGDGIGTGGGSCAVASLERRKMRSLTKELTDDIA